MTTAISVKNLGKQYVIGAAETKFRYNMLRDVIVDTISAPIRLAKALVGKSEGDVVDVAVPGGTRAFEIVAVRYA